MNALTAMNTVSRLAALATLPIEIAAPDIKRWQRATSDAIGAGGTTQVQYVHERSGALPGPDVLVTALVHGNEFSGAIALDELLASSWQPMCGRVTFAFCNVAAFARFDAAQPDAARFVDEDFNRVWSDARLATDERPNGGIAKPIAGPAAKPTVELARARELLPFVARATHLLDLHSMHERGAPLLVTGTLKRNIDFAQALQTASQVIIDSGHADGVRLRDCGAFADPAGERVALLLEAGQHWQASSVAVARNTLARFLVAAGTVSRPEAQTVFPDGWLLPDTTPPTPVQVTDRVVAQSMNFAFTHTFTGGEVIAKAGTVIAHDNGKPVLTPYDSCVLVMPSVRQLRAGVTVVRLGQLVGAA